MSPPGVGRENAKKATESLNFLINHIFLPPKLPQRCDVKASDNADFLKFIVDAASDYGQECVSPVWKVVAKMLGELAWVMNCGSLNGQGFGVVLRRMQCGDVLALHISAQNAGLVIRHMGNEIQFESFEVSPRPAPVMCTSGRLACSFPGPVMLVPVKKIQEPGFSEELATFLEQMDRDVLKNAMPSAWKAGTQVVETRDTASPMYITGMLSGILRGMGRAADNPQRIQKQVRDDVLWSDAKLPWRRSALWLVIRVAIQTTVSFGGEGELYKSFMIFVMSRLLDLAKQRNLASDTLFVMRAKLSRRVEKAGKALPELVLERACGVVESTSEVLLRRWEREHPAAISSHVDPDTLSIHTDTAIRLEGGQGYIDRIKERPDAGNPTTANAIPLCTPRVASSGLEIPDVGAAGDDLALFDFERWVEQYLNTWITENIQQSETCRKLADRIVRYTAVALNCYKSSPSDLSIMLLTTVMLWVALDQAALHHCPLLADYPPEIPPSILTLLVLPKKRQMESLRQVEQYIIGRSKSCRKYPTIFSGVINKNAFAVRFFQSSPTLHKLNDKIVAAATEARAQKQDEYYRKSREYTNLLTQAAQTPCTCPPDPRCTKCKLDLEAQRMAYARSLPEDLQKRDGYSRKSREYTSLLQEAARTLCTCPLSRNTDTRCTKCNLNLQARQLSITVHEWPLPQDGYQRMLAVFELKCPPTFCAWRDATYRILAEVFAHGISFGEDPEPKYGSFRGGALGAYFEGSHRISLESRTKSFLAAHYRDHNFPTTVEAVCVPSGFRFGLWDGSYWVEDRLGRNGIREMCTPTLQAGIYSKLQYAVAGTTHTPNEVIAAQCDCHPQLLIHEYEAFGLLRSGHRLQWLNIARELRARNLTFSQEAVNILVLHASCQAGPASEVSALRESHYHLAAPEFGHQLLAEIAAFWDSIGENWLEAVSGNTLIRLTARILSLATDGKVKSQASDLLRRARGITLRWTRQVACLLKKATQQDDIKALRARILMLAATCRATYNVDTANLQSVLNSDDDVATVVECAIMIQRNTPRQHQGLPHWTCRLLERDRRLSMELEYDLRRLILGGGGGIDGSIWRTGYEYTPGTDWEAMPKPGDRWLFTTTRASEQERERNISYNLLDGQILVDGYPLGRLPTSFSAHETYIRTFGNEIFDAFPATRPDMDYVIHNIFGYTVYFRMAGGELVIQIERSGHKLELIPFTMLSQDFPTRLVQSCSHWYDHATGKIEFRPLSNMWESSPDNWRLQTRPGLPCTMTRGDNKLVDKRSGTAKWIYAVLEPIEVVGYIEISYSRSLGVVSAHLPRLRLDFFINANGAFECRQFRSMIVDPDQSIGTLHGLSSKLVLREMDRSKGYHARKVTIPYGIVEYTPTEWHVRVKIKTDAGEHLRYHAYDIDTKLGRLTGGGSLASRYYLIYLHAVTSHCLPDPLTGRTGTEEALHGLREAASWSFQSLDETEEGLLDLIATLTPLRQYYPAHLQVMQTVTWDPNLSPLSQHEEFRDTALDILNHDAHFDIFRPTPVKGTPSGIGYPERENGLFLSLRAAVRAASFRSASYGGTLISQSEDTHYDARDKSDERDARVATVAALADSWSEIMPCHDKLIGALKSLDTLSKPKDLEIRYSNDWLKPSLSVSWLSFYETFRKFTSKDRYRLMMFLCTLTYSNKVDMKLVWTLLAFATIGDFRDMPLPDADAYDLSRGSKPILANIEQVLRASAMPFSGSEASELELRNGESYSDLWARRRREYNRSLNEEISQLGAALVEQWPCASPRSPRDIVFRLLSIEQAESAVLGLFKEWERNRLFEEHISHVQGVLSRQRSEVGMMPVYTFKRCDATPKPRPMPITLGGLLSRDVPDLPAPCGSIEVEMREGENTRGGRLQSVVSGLREESTGWDQAYACDLQLSLEALRGQPGVSTAKIPAVMHSLIKYRAMCHSYMEEVFRRIRYCLEDVETDWVQSLVKLSGLYPRVTPTSLLKLLLTLDPSHPWSRVIVQFGVAITMVQRAERLHACALSKNEADFAREAENTGHRDWDPIKQPKSLLMEIDNDLLVRRVQTQIVSEMMRTSSDGNIVLQLNMGEGKSSVIVPIVTAELADGKKLVRVVVLKPLSTQMFRLLAQKLGRLVNCRIYYMPFSRDVQMDESTAQHIQALYKGCMEDGGILVAQPEHLLSFKLMGLERLSSNARVANILLDTQRWLGSHARDVLDESDEILHVRYQLVYTLGEQRPIDHHPDRWIIVQQLFEVIENRINGISECFPQGVEFEKRDSEQPGSYPTIRILHTNAGNALLDMIAADIREGRLSVNFRFFPLQIAELALRFIRDPSLEESGCLDLLDYITETGACRDTLLLLRGLIARGIILSAIQDKRWRVDYGLDPRRSMLAVPYRAKDCPAVRAEFSHPDVAIALTCLSYYYGGLTDEQLEACFKALLKLDNPILIYEDWLARCGPVEDRFKTIQGVNLEDQTQRRDIFKLLKRNKRVADFYLSTFVFPMEAKEFPSKLSTSGWDIAEERTHPTTGFSGTNDNRYLLPLSITQRDLPELLSTNAVVLENLLRPENNHYRCAEMDGNRLNVNQLLDLIVAESPPIRVVLDVGAQVLELDNRGVAELWLEKVPSSLTGVQAAVFFDDDDDLVVLGRDGTSELFMTSSFAGRLDQCLVYLDEVHTRGTDLKLPTNTRAAVTLGPKLTKDRLVQACMRMRKLGQGQSVMFFAPPEVNNQILLAVSKPPAAEADTADVVRWAISETCASTRSSVPLWASQGLSHQRAQSAWLNYTTSGIKQSDFSEPESQTLAEMYGFGAGHDPLHEPISETCNRVKEILEIREKCKSFGVTTLLATRQQEEQEREVLHEIEREQQIERPPKATPHKHVLSAELREFVRTGVVPEGICESAGSAFLMAFRSLADCTSAREDWVDGWHSCLLVTRDFANTIVSSGSIDSYLRPVNWVLSTSTVLVIISPFEANELITDVRSSQHVGLHVYAPKVTNTMKTFEDFSFLSIPESWERVPRLLTPQLNLFAGQLYFRNYAAYRDVCHLLGLYAEPSITVTTATTTAESVRINSDGFVIPSSRQALGMVGVPTFSRSPAPFLTEIVGLRRKGLDYEPSHVGKMLHGRLLLPTDF